LVRGLKTRAGAQFKLQPVVIDWPDVQNGVASRQSVTRDFMHDAHAMPGVMRLGPDLANAGGRPALADVNQFYVHLYQPRLISEKSAMPPYRYLFRKVKLNAGESAPDNALKHADLEEGYAIVPTEKAEALFEFLKSLRTDALPEAPIVQLPPTANE
jgi:cytochrome c oxidase cbb3-type subunit 2